MPLSLNLPHKLMKGLVKNVKNGRWIIHHLDKEHSECVGRRPAGLLPGHYQARAFDHLGERSGYVVPIAFGERALLICVILGCGVVLVDCNTLWGTTMLWRA